MFTISIAIVIVLEAYSRMILKAEEGGYIQGFAVGNDGDRELRISHLLLADDTLISVEQNQISYGI